MGRTETSVFRGHVKRGDVAKLSDSIYRHVLDACKMQDPLSEVDCDFSSLNNTGTAFVRINTRASVDFLKIAEHNCRLFQFFDVFADPYECNVVFQFERSYRGGHISGYATNETPEMLPIGQVFETTLAARLNEAWRDGTCPWLGPNGQIHIAFEYDKETMLPTRIHTIHISIQHEVVTDEFVANLLPVIRDVIPEQYLDRNTFIQFQPSPSFVIESIQGYNSLTCGRLVKGVFGGWGDFTNQKPKENTARLAAKHIVAEGYARRCSVDVYYDIGAPQPLSVYVDTYGTGTISDEEILKIVKREFDFGPDILAMNLDHGRGGGNGSFLKTALPMDFFGGLHGGGNCEALRFGPIGISCH